MKNVNQAVGDDRKSRSKRRYQHLGIIHPIGLVVGLFIGFDAWAAERGEFKISATPMTTPRMLHEATLLCDGAVLITGGASEEGGDSNVATAEVYLPSSGVFALATGTPLN